MSAAATPPTRPTCPRPISGISSGHPRASPPGRARSARRPPPSSRRSSRIARIPSRATARASASCGWARAMARPGWRRPVRGRSSSAPVPIATSIPCSSTASTASPCRRPPRSSPSPRPTTISAGRPTTSEGDPLMLTAPTMEHLQALKLDAMAAAWTAQQQHADLTALAFDERFGLLVEAEWGARENKRLVRALQEAKLKLSQACIEAIDYPARRELDKAVVRQLAPCRWVEEHQGVLISGMTGTGKSFLACALAHQACRKGYRALYRRASRLFHELTLARADGTYIRLLAKLARTDVLLIDDFALAPLQDQERRDLLEILEDRYGTRSTIITNQLPPTQYHDYIGEPTLADAI